MCCSSKTIADSGRVFLETNLKANSVEGGLAADFSARSDILETRFGTLRNIKGDWRKMGAFFGEEPLLADYAKAAAGYGHANFLPDPDQIFRHQPLVARMSSLAETPRLDELKPGYTVDSSKFERLAWMDKDGEFHDIDTPLTEKSLASLKAQMEKSAPQVQSASSTDQYYIVRKYKDSFIPSITLALAANYLGVKLSDVEVVLGKYIRLPSPTSYDSDSGRARSLSASAHSRPIRRERQPRQGGTKRTLDKIDIPIDSEGMMLINFMGLPSSDCPRESKPSLYAPTQAMRTRTRVPTKPSGIGPWPSTIRSSWWGPFPLAWRRTRRRRPWASCTGSRSTRMPSIPSSWTTSSGQYPAGPTS